MRWRHTEAAADLHFGSQAQLGGAGRAQAQQARRTWVMEWSRPNGFPSANTFCPTSRLADVPTETGFSSAAFSGGHSSCRTAMSLSGSPEMYCRHPTSACAVKDLGRLAGWPECARVLVSKDVYQAQHISSLADTPAAGLRCPCLGPKRCAAGLHALISLVAQRHASACSQAAHLGWVGALVDECDLDVGCPPHHMVVGDDVALQHDASALDKQLTCVWTAWLTQPPAASGPELPYKRANAIPPAKRVACGAADVAPTVKHGVNHS